MRIALVQQNIIWAAPQDNRSALDALLCGVDRPDLVVLPEMFSTGFATVPEGIAEEAPSATLSWMKERAAKYDCAIAGSIAIHEDGRYYNRFCFVKPDGSVTQYDKRHLFTYGGEGKTFTRGEERVVVEFRGVRFLLLVCYDLRFPVWMRNRRDYDAILCVANWPDVRRGAWDILTKARAIENQCFFAAVNRVGADPSCKYDGGTALISPYGETLASAADGAEEVVTFEFDLQHLAEFRKKFPVLEDAENFEMI